jgi:acyl-CoA dehydrogenase
MDAPGVEVVRPLMVFGYDDAPHGHAETAFTNVRLGDDALLWKEGHGFALAQNRLGPGRLHHCARLVGHSERALRETVRRGTLRQAFGKSLLDLGGNEERLARCRVALNQARLTVLTAAAELDLRDHHPGSKLRPKALEALAVCKIATPRAAEECLDLAVQIHGGGGLSSDHPLAAMWAAARTLRLVDGPDEVHLRTLAKMERKREKKALQVHPGVGNPRL